MKKLTNIFPKKQLGIYLITGAWNTIFGYVVYALFVYLFNENFSFSYMLAAILSNVVALTQSFLTYKYVVFKTKGNFWTEYIKCWGVYSTSFLITLTLLPIMVSICEAVLPLSYKHLSPYLGGFILLGITVLISFLGHKNITFKKQILLKN